MPFMLFSIDADFRLIFLPLIFFFFFFFFFFFDICAITDFLYY